MDDKDNNEVPRQDTETVKESNEQKIKVNIGVSDDSEKTEEISTAQMQDDVSGTEVDNLDKTEKTEEENSTENQETEENTYSQEPTKEEPKEQIAAEPLKEQEVNEIRQDPAPNEEQKTVEAAPLANEGPELKPSVQPVQTAAVTPPSEILQLKKRNKSLKIWLVLFIILLVAILSAGVVYFNQKNKDNSRITDLESQNSSLQKQLTEQQNTATQQKIDELNNQLNESQVKVEELSATISENEATIDSYRQTVTDLKEACGVACDTVELPDALDDLMQTE